MRLYVRCSDRHKTLHMQRMNKEIQKKFISNIHKMGKIMVVALTFYNTYLSSVLTTIRCNFIQALQCTHFPEKKISRHNGKKFKTTLDQM